MRKLCVAVLLTPSFLLPFAAQADEYGLQSVGVGVTMTQSPYAGAGSSVSLLPLLNYEGQRLFVRGMTGGVHLYEQEGFALDVIVSGRFDGIDAEDFGRDELASNGINRDWLDDRDDGLDLGLQASWEGSAGQLRATAKGDISGTSDGYELSLEYGYPLQVAGVTVVPSVAVSYLSDKLGNYYYGTLGAEEARGVARYHPDSAVVPSVAVGIAKPLNDRWMLNAEAGYQWLPGNITDSPLTEGDSGQLGVRVGLSWIFD